MSLSFKEAFARLESAARPDPALVGAVFDSILEGDWNPTQVAAFAVALRLRGETPEVIAAAARALRRHMVPLVHNETKLLDTCGTGGDGLGSLNLSTGAAIIAAAAGARVAKHGNRAATSKAGSADVLESLGVRIDLTPDEEARVLADTGLVFLFAQKHHPAMRHVGQARRELGVRTLFNCLGPLANPADAKFQLLGAYDDQVRPLLARSLVDLGVERAWVVRGVDGMDELSPYGATRVTIVDGGDLREVILTPEHFGLSPCEPGATDGGDANENAAILEGVLRGEPHPSRDAFLLNAAGALAVYHGIGPAEATDQARRALESGAALAQLETWRKAAPLAGTSGT
ncbi:MAG TPA: anthranilate phosphoribosyltransferase [Polyangiaceae bacterium]|nr:anthranilate phosphoribosyltransferase [Polyangiaceae bacterium]